MELVAYIQAGTSTDQLNISCCYLLFTEKLKMNPCIIQFKLIFGLLAAIFTYISDISGICTIMLSCVPLTLSHNEMPWLHSLSSHRGVLFLLSVRWLSEQAGWSH